MCLPCAVPGQPPCEHTRRVKPSLQCHGNPWSRGGKPTSCRWQACLQKFLFCRAQFALLSSPRVGKMHSVFGPMKRSVFPNRRKSKTAQNNATAVASGTGIDGSVVGRPLAANVDGNSIDGTIVGRPLAANGADDTPPPVERLSEEDAMVAGQEMDRRIALARAKQSVSADDRPLQDESIKLPVSEREGKTSARVLKRPASKRPA